MAHSPAKRVKLKDIADKASISVAAVSMALADHPRIGDETKRRVRRLSKELGYDRNPRQRRINVEPTQTSKAPIGYVLIGERLENDVEAHTLHALMDAANAAGVRMHVSALEKENDAALTARRIIDMAPAGGVLLCGWIERPLVEAMNQAGVPHVIIGAMPSNGLMPGEIVGHVVTADFEAMGYAAASTLIRWGHRRIAFLSDMAPVGMFCDCWRRGYRAALLDAGIALDPSLVWVANKRIIPDDEFIDPLLTQKDPPTGFVIPSVTCAAMFRHAMAVHGRELNRESMVVAAFPALAEKFGLADFPTIGYDLSIVAPVAIRHLQQLQRTPAACGMRITVPFMTINMDSALKRT